MQYKHAYGPTFGNQQRAHSLHVGSIDQPTDNGRNQDKLLLPRSQSDPYEETADGDGDGDIERSIQWQGQQGGFVRKLIRWCVTLAVLFFVAPNCKIEAY